MSNVFNHAMQCGVECTRLDTECAFTCNERHAFAVYFRRNEYYATLSD